MTATHTAQTANWSGSEQTDLLIAHLRDVALRALRQMYSPHEGVFAFRLRKDEDGGTPQLEGVSDRYTAIALIGLADEPADVVNEVLAGHGLEDVCGRLIERTGTSQDLGEVALTLWAARVLAHPAAAVALQNLRNLAPHERSCPTVELSWALTAQVVPGGAARDEYLTDALARRLLDSFRPDTALFPHWPVGAQASMLRAHVACFADLVYPIQALAHYHRVRGDAEALQAASVCAQRMCALQGPAGQWWWHYDIRTGRVVEPFPVYAVHQDAMAPMALQALAQATGDDPHRAAVRRGVEWLHAAPELQGGSLIDEQVPAIWRKVGRREPGRLVRSLQAGASRLHPALRVPRADRLFPPGRIDFESRPYHMGWLLYAWPRHNRRL